MTDQQERMLYTAIGTGAAVAAAIAARNLLDKGWESARGTPAPRNPADREIPWGDAILWTAVTGAVIGVSRMLARRGAAAGWSSVTGESPPTIE